jgi:MFS family permease
MPAVPALAEPIAPVGRVWTAGLAAVNVGVYAAFFGPIQVLLAQQSEHLAPGNKELVFGVVTGAGAAVSVVANPVFGALSDRTTSRFGRRVPWVVGGAVAGFAGLLVLAGADAIALMLVGWCVVQAACNALLAAITAAVPDRVPHAQRGTVGGWVGLGQTVGGLAGVGLAFATGGFRAGYVACGVFLLVLVTPYVLRGADAVLPRSLRPPFDRRALLKSFWVSPRRYPDFAWAWLTRFLVNLGNALGTLYLFFYLQDEVRYGDAEGGVLVLTLIYSVCVVVTAVWSGNVRTEPAVAGSSSPSPVW